MKFSFLNDKNDSYCNKQVLARVTNSNNILLSLHDQVPKAELPGSNLQNNYLQWL